MNGMCIYQGCNKISSFNIPNETITLYCSEHKLVNMVNVTNNKFVKIY